MTTTLLAVDDSVTMRKVLEITFAGESYKTLLASSAQEALALTRSERPVLVLVDHTLPDMSGYDLCRELKSQTPGLAVVILSSKVSPYDKTRGAGAGVDDFMDKPFDTQKLLDKVAQVLSQPRAAAPAGAAAVAPAAAPAPVTAAQGAPVAARPRSQTLSYGTSAVPPPAAASAPSPHAPQAGTSRTLPGTPAATPKPATAHAPPATRPAAPPVGAAKPGPAPSIAAAVAAAGNGQLSGKLEALGLTPAQVEGVLSLSREVVERVVWEVVPVLAETIIKEEIRRLTTD